MSPPVFAASAPGRLDVMGGIADYSGSLVLQLPIHERTYASISLRNDFQCSVASTTEARRVTLDYRHLVPKGIPDYEYARKQLNANPEDAWIAYVLGCVIVLQKEKQIEFVGADIEIRSEVPPGKGVSSSAALEVAVMKALANAFEVTFDGTELARLAQKVEHRIVGAPCGLMDQLATCFGESNKLLPILCQPDRLFNSIPVPDTIAFIGIDSGIRHAVTGASYGDVRCAAFMGYSMIARAMGAQDSLIQTAIERQDFSTLPFGGYLANCPVQDFEQRFSPSLPGEITGKEFRSRFAITIDPVTRVNDNTTYAVLPCTAHPMYEHRRVNEFMNLVVSLNESAASQNRIIAAMGALMYESHESYSRCGLGSPRTDEIVAMAKQYASRGIAGAKITGGGSGGTVCLLVQRPHGIEAAREIHARLQEKYGQTLVLLE